MAASLHKRTVQEALNASLGQGGAILVTGTTACTCDGGVFVAIQFIEDTVFASGSGGLIAEDAEKFINTEDAANDLAAGSESSVEGSGGQVVDSVIFPAGLTIYGRWSEIDVATGSCVAYVG